MADKKISQLNSATPLSGTELVPVVQGGETKKVTAQAIADLGSGGGGGGAVDSVNGQTGVVVLTKSDIGLANVDNTSDANKPISSATSAALALKANTSSLATVATSGAYNDLTGKPTLGTAAAQNSSAFATAAQGALADTAVQPGDLAAVATSGDFSDLVGVPQIAIRVAVPATATDPGSVGEYAVDADYLYHCIATNTWVRVPVSTF